MNILYFDTISSTNTYLKNKYELFPNMQVVCANTQTNGRGRMDRKWIDSDDLLFSILIKEKLKNYSNLSLLIALAVSKALENLNIKPTIKWPNDIMVDDKKVCGILLEALTKDKIECVIIGVGLNVNSQTFSQDLIIKANSLRNILGRKLNKDNLLLDILNIFNEYLQEYKNDSRKYLDEINNRFYLLDKEVTYIQNNNEKKGVVLGVNDSGEILIKTDNDIISLNYGEITLKNIYKE